jgi:hypothetical protein
MLWFIFFVAGQVAVKYLGWDQWWTSFWMIVVLLADLVSDLACWVNKKLDAALAALRGRRS